MKNSICYKNREKSSCVDLSLTNYVLETGLSNFLKMTATLTKIYFKKYDPKILAYRDYKNFDKDLIRSMQMLRENFVAPTG